MTVTSFRDPDQLADSIFDCLGTLWEDDVWAGMVKFKGPLGYGNSISCCPTPVLRVESGPVQPVDQRGRSWLGRPNGCVDLQQIMVATYRECYKTTTRQGQPLTVNKTSEQAAELEVLRWGVIQRLACCRDAVIEFINLRVDEPATCTGWTLTVAGMIRMCAADC